MKKIVKKPFKLPDKLNYTEMFYLILFYCTVLHWHFWGMCVCVGGVEGKMKKQQGFL